MGETVSGLEHDTFVLLRSQFRAEARASYVAAAGTVVVALALREPWGVVLGVLIAVMAVVRTLAFGPLDRGDVERAMWWKACGTWGVAVGVVAIEPAALPIMMLNVVGPLVTGSLYLASSQLRRLTLGGVAITVVLGVLADVSGGVGFDERTPHWLLQSIIVLFLVMHVVMMIVSVGTANRMGRDTLEAVVSAGEALVESEAELRASRRRVITAGDDERIRIERDLHDGAQQRLVALTVQLQLAEQLARGGSPPDADQLAAFCGDCREAIDELRDLARGIYPPVLVERGLGDALRSAGQRSPIPVTVDVDEDVELDRNDAAAIYFICLEALQNAAKHAPGSTAAVSVRRSDADGCVVEVVDDGPGFDVDAVGPSRGLLNMADRSGALGAELTVEATPGSGTRVTVLLPVERPATLGR